MDQLERFLESTERVRLMPGPTPFERLRRLEQLWNYGDIFVKRDDMTGVGLGGNKIRSLEYILGKALKEGYDKILAAGPGQSNLCMLTAAACAKLGLECELIHNCSHPKQLTGNLLLNNLLGVKSHFLGPVDARTRNNYMEELCVRYSAEGKRPYVVRNGATTGRGALGYTAAVPELMAQCREAGIDRMTIFAPGGNGGVATGLIYGNVLFGNPFDLVIVSVEDDCRALEAHIRETLTELESVTGIKMGVAVNKACHLTDEYRGEGWGVNTKESAEEVFEFARQEGIFIENVYDSKVVVGMRCWILDHRVNGPVCYLHTGGLGSLFAQY